MNKYNRISLFVVFIVLICIALGSVNAADAGSNTTNNTTIANFTNPGFESGNLTGWTAGSTINITNSTSHSGNYSAHFSNVADPSTNYITQSVNLTNVNYITFWGQREDELDGALNPLYVYIDNILVQTIIPTYTWTQYTILTSNYTDLHNITIAWYGNYSAAWPSGHYGFDIDDFSINAPTANFTSNITNGTSPLTVQFNDTSTNNPTSWLWDFGDGTTSNLQNPTHTYTTPGIYTVTLTATNEADHNKASDNGKLTKTNYITVMDSTMPVVVAQPSGGPYNTTQNVTLITIDPYGTTTYYTTDGTDPQTSTTRKTYTEPITINQTTTLRYIAVNSNNIWSPEYIQNYTLDFTAPTVTSNVNNGTYNTTQAVTLTTTDPNSVDTTYYTTDGSDPRTSTTRTTYTKPITIDETTTLRYAAVDPAGNWSPLYIQNYIIGNGTITNSVNTSGQSNYTGPQTNTTYWTYNIGGSSVVTISQNGTIYVGSCNINNGGGALYAFSPNGTLLWKYTTYGGISAAPTIGSDGTIYIGSYYGVFYVINPDGTLKWEYDTGNIINYITNSPVVSPDGTVYVSVRNSGLYAFTSNGTLKWIKRGTGGVTIDSNGIIHVGGNAYNQDGTSSTETTSSQTVGPDGIIYTINGVTITATNPNGTIKWTYTAENSTKYLEITCFSIASDGTIYFGVDNGYCALYALEPNGTVKWVYQVSGSPYNCLIGSDGTIYISIVTALESYGVDDPQHLDVYAFNPNGTVKWTYHIGGSYRFTLASDGTIYIGSIATGIFYAIKDVPTASFTTNTSNGTAPLTVQFNDTSTNNPTTWTWNFGDGITSTEKNPTHTYTKPGTYTVTLKVGNNAANSTITSTITVIDITSPTVTSNVDNGTYNTAQIVTLNATDDSGTTTIYYTTDDTNPTNSTTKSVYNNPIVINSTTTLLFAAVDATGNWSPIYAQTYTIDKTAPTATVNIPGESYNASKTVTLSMSENGTIYYTTNGSTPTTNSKKYTGPINIASTTTLKYIAVDTAGNQSPVYTQTYTIDKTAPTASANVKTGTYNANKVITLKMSENGTIYYTTNGSTPTTSSKKYTGSFTISSTTTLKFFAVDKAGNKSPVYTVKYTIDKIAPKVSAISPTSSATSVSRTKTVSIRLSENIVKGVNWSRVYIKNLKTGQKCKATIWISGNHIYITTSKKAALTWYQVYIPASAIKDSAGNNLVKSYTWKFKTGKN